MIEFIRSIVHVCCVCVCDEGAIVGNYILPVRLLIHDTYISTCTNFLVCTIQQPVDVENRKPGSNITEKLNKSFGLAFSISRLLCVYRRVCSC